MRIVRYRHRDRTGYGVLHRDRVAGIVGDPFRPLRPTREWLPLDKVQLLAPVEPRNVIGMGRNSGDGVPEVPVAFLKPATGVVGPGAAIVHPGDAGRVDYEGELVIVVGRRARRLTPATAASAILGFTCGNDVTARELQAADEQWTRAKGYDSFSAVGPWVETVLDPADLGIRTFVNGELRQKARTSELARGPVEILVFLSSFMTLHPGDLIFTGAPGQVGPIRPGDRVEVEIEGIGVLANPVVAETPAAAQRP
jgi:2-keto-4-pentenoate hydratase/2-oxohepta-3-ene-1,7-dioic acid hydratase in catechol pathway